MCIYDRRYDTGLPKYTEIPLVVLACLYLYLETAEILQVCLYAYV